MIGIQNSTIITFDPAKVEENLDIIIDDGQIIDKGKNIIKNYPDCKIVEKEKIVTTGIVCSHTHIYSALARGLNVKLKKMNDFVQILQNLWWLLDRALDKEMVEVSAQVCAIEAILCGVTTLVDHHSSPNFIEGSLKTIKDSFEKIGIRSILCYETTDRNGVDKANLAIFENESFANLIDEEKKKKKKKERLTEASIGAHAPFTLSDETLKGLSTVCNKIDRGLHIHVSEDRFDPSYSRFSFDKDPIKRLNDFGLISDKSIIGHGVHLSEDEIDIINKNDAFLVHNSRSNMNNNVGYNNQLGEFKNVAIGTDGINHDLISELATSYFKHKDSGGQIPISKFLQMLNNGNLILNRYFSDLNFGRIEKGFAADLVIWDYKTPAPINQYNIASHLIFGFNSGFVNTVIINGKVILKDRKFNFDINDIFKNSQNQAIRLADAMVKLI
jgi:putative selenium metabolism protein SsnA